jgi:hypothetical protein
LRDKSLQLVAQAAGIVESALAAYQERAERAEQWLHRIYGEIEDRFLQQGGSRRPVNGSPQRSQNQRRSR